jgi:hypothetical protein
VINVPGRCEDKPLQFHCAVAQCAHNLRILSRENGAQIEFKFSSCDVADDWRRAAPESGGKIFERNCLRP